MSQLHSQASAPPRVPPRAAEEAVPPAHPAAATDAADAAAPPASRRGCVLFALALLALVIGAYALFTYLPMLDYLVAVSDWVHTRGAGGAVLFVSAMMLWIVLFMPSTPLELLCSFTYGFWWSLPLNTLGKVGGGTIAFLLGRHVGRARVQQRFARMRFLRAMEAAVARQGWCVVLLVQYAFVPMWVKNYGLSVMSAVSAPLFAATCFLAGFPFTVALGYVGSTARDLIGVLRGEGSVGRVQKIMIIGGLAALALCIGLIGRYVRRALRELDLEDRQDDGPSPVAQEGRGVALVVLDDVTATHSAPSPVSSGRVKGGEGGSGTLALPVRNDTVHV